MVPCLYVLTVEVTAHDMAIILDTAAQRVFDEKYDYILDSIADYVFHRHQRDLLVRQ